MRRLKKVLRNKWQRTWAQCDLGDVKIPRWLAGTSLLSTSHVCLCACCVTNWLKKKKFFRLCVCESHTLCLQTLSQVWRANLRRYVLHTRGPGGSWSLSRTLVTSWFSPRARRSKVRRLSVIHHGTCKQKQMEGSVTRREWCTLAAGLSLNHGCTIEFNFVEMSGWYSPFYGISTYHCQGCKTGRQAVSRSH